MRTSCIFGFGLVASLASLSVACGSDGSASNAGGGGGGNVGGMGATGGGGSGGASGGAGGASGGAAGAGGASGGAAGAGGASGGSGGAGGTGGGSGGSGGSGTAGDHLLITEVGLEPGGAEFIEIYNPTNAEVDLSNYYLADNSAYHKVTSGPWNPQGTPNTDFLARFPAGAKLAAKAVLTIGQSGFEATFSKCPTYALNSTAAALSCGGSNVPAMTIPTNGSVGSQVGALLSNDREMVVLFRWDGTATKVEDVDYVTWGTAFDDNTRIDKTAVAGYQPDTPRANQKSANQGVAGDGGASLAIQRCAIETGEKLAGGNGMTGHDETSEDMGQSFKSQSTPSPGVKNTCLP